MSQNLGKLSKPELDILVRWTSETPTYWIAQNDSDEPGILTPISAAELIHAINERLRQPGYLGKVLAVGGLSAVLLAVVFNPNYGYWFLGPAVIGALWAGAADRRKRKIALTFEQDAAGEEAANRVAEVFSALKIVKGIWDLREQKQVKITASTLPGLACNLPAVAMEGLTPAFYFLPDRIYTFDGTTYSSLSYDQFHITSFSNSPVRSDSLIPGERAAASAPEAQDGQLRIVTINGQMIDLGVSDAEAAASFTTAFQRLASSQSEASKTIPLTNPEEATLPMSDPLNLLRLSRSPSQPAISDAAKVSNSSETLFLEAARKFHDETGDSCEPAPFDHHWPSYEKMDDLQRRWYFYWRTEARRGNYLPTDASYLFLHAYEILNLVEKSDPLEAAAYIKALWRAYRAEYKEVNRHFPEWSGDLIAEHVGAEMALDWWEEMLDEVPLSISIINALIQRASEGNALAELPMEVWWRLTDFRPESRFCELHNTDGAVTEIHRRALAIADQYWRVKTGCSVVEKFVTADAKPKQKILFVSAMIGRGHPAIQFAPAREYVGNPILSLHLNSVMRHAENVLREQINFPHRLSGIGLSEELKTIIRDLLVYGQTPPLAAAKNVFGVANSLLA